jgi:hypothetical protein
VSFVVPAHFKIFGQIENPIFLGLKQALERWTGEKLLFALKGGAVDCNPQIEQNSNLNHYSTN